MNDQATLKDYFETKKAIDDLNKYLGTLKPKVVEILDSNEGKIETGFANFTIRPFTTYTYSNRVIELENQLKALKKEELDSGVATVKSESYSPVMRAKRKGGEE